QGAAKRAGTEVYDGGDDDDDQDDDAAPVPGISLPTARILPPTSSRGSHPRLPSRTSSSKLMRAAEPKLQGVVELTSIHNRIDLENQHREPVPAGLVSALPRLYERGAEP